MKTKMFAIVTLAALVLAACENPAQSAGTANSTTRIPSDKGIVLLSVTGAPETLAAQAAQDTDYSAGYGAASIGQINASVRPTVSGTYAYRWTAFTETPGIETPIKNGELSESTPAEIVLEPGAWTITVKAWADAAPEDPDDNEAPKPAFIGTDRLHVYAGTAESFAIGLHPNADGGDGTFSYTVTFNNNIANTGYAFISVYPLDDGPVADVIDLKGPNTTLNGSITGTAQLPAGYYNIATSVNYKDSDTQKFATKREVLYIYAGKTSNYSETFLTTDFTALLGNKGGVRSQTFGTASEGLWYGVATDRYLEGVMGKMPQNTPDAPYIIALGTMSVAGTNATGSNFDGKRLGTTLDPFESMIAVTQGRYVFYDLTNCTGTEIPAIEMEKTLERVYADRITGIILPPGVTSIGSYVFYKFSSLTHITLPASLTTIGADAFIECSSLAHIDIPASVSTIGARAFSGCNNLKTITLRSTSGNGGSVTINSSSLGASSDKSLEAIYVPSNLLAGYKEAAKTVTRWKTVFTKYTESRGLDPADGGTVSAYDDFFKAIPE